MKTLTNIICGTITFILFVMTMACAIGFTQQSEPGGQAYFLIMTLFMCFGGYLASEGIRR